jgi:flagellar basal-body rod protein FlgG
MQALRTAATGMAAQQMNVEVISNNIANMNTVAFKRQRAEFQDLLYQTFEAAGTQSSDQGTIVPTGVQVGAGVKAGAVYRVSTQGSLTRTDNQYDLAIDGRGYFQVLTALGRDRLHRAGNFSVNDQGQLVTQDGYQIQPAITIPTDAVSVSVSKSGQVEVTQAGPDGPQRGRRPRTGHLRQRGRPERHRRQPAEGNRGLRAAHHRHPGLGRHRHPGAGLHEASNVDAVAEITALIVAQRAYEMNSKVISTADSMLATANQVKA